MEMLLLLEKIEIVKCVSWLKSIETYKRVEECINKDKVPIFSDIQTTYSHFANTIYEIMVDTRFIHF